MPALKQEVRESASPIAQLFRQTSPLLGLGIAGVTTWALAAALQARLGETLCAPGYELVENSCQLRGALAEARVWVPAMELVVGASDFEAAGRSASGTLKTTGFFADPWELHAPPAQGNRALALSWEGADRACKALGGRLPTSEEWVLMASHPKRARYPWGETGLLCRTAAWGRAAGPCRWGGGPDAPGAHPAGCTDAGICDLVGNMAEWASDGTLHGGSYAATFAGALRVWSVQRPKAGESPPHAGARCVYDTAP